ncbi:HD-GYP domain-containing protein [Aquabacterium sp.]|uniref:HD-GYP domain-containing protein n=1 Tax=Aquabacterium sp. TaxID=1872578 RepID=UPI002BD9B5FF|nr:two-component system response regulator [Aquabacterium sp.]HSW08954.1 two-component system response regulator [Aquabacterium sp.]
MGQGGEPVTLPLVLIVDDNPENLTVIGELLQPHHAVRAANSGARALKLAVMAPQPQLVLLDVMMPEMDGYEVLERLRSDPATADIPVMFLTALDDQADEERGLKLGAVDYVTKPIHPPILLARVDTQLELAQARKLMRDRNVWLEAEVARRMGENQLIQDVSIHALARLAEIRDPETGNHLLRTQGYVRALARRLQHHPRFVAMLTDHTIELLAKSAPLHDIGKVGIPDHILLKPGKLDAQEWLVMQTHAGLGAEAIEHAETDVARPVEFLTLAKQIARSHHERWDGLGYPDGLAGDDIPVAARLMALADVFDALISRRVYKPPFPHQQAYQMIVKERGLHFDPDVVQAFIDGFDELRAIAEAHADSDEHVAAKLASVGGQR